ncbi:MAG: YqaA family protein [Bacillota bacterium]|nr:YqaA family protein [Bacillota bacterium]
MVEKTINLFLHYDILGLFLISFMESSFFPIPPDLVLIPLGILNPSQVWWYASVTTGASVFGGVFAYFLGKKLGRPLIERIVSDKRIQQVERRFADYGGWAILIAGLTPIPYKVFTLAAGLFKIDLITFIIASIIGRGVRFYAEAAVIVYLGPQADKFFKEYLDVMTIVIAVALVGSYMIVRFFRKPHPKQSQTKVD